MSLHRLTAGSGYDYLTRQVAVMDSTERGHTGLASYYTEKGEVPGRWVGTGLVGIDGLDAGDQVSAEQMLALFGSGHHPLAAQRAAALADDPEASEQDVLDAIRLGRPFAVHAGDVSSFRIEVAHRLHALNKAAGRSRDAAVGIEERARVRTEVGLEWFKRDMGRAPLNQRELSGHIARLSRQKTTAVAGFDLTFSPVKSVSSLWALADPPLAATIERAHQAAVADAMRFIESHALYSRTGAHGVRQVDVHGLIGAAFTHRDSRAGDPDLHTHVAVANKVQTLDGKWLSIDSRVLHKAITAASETYNTALEAHLTHTVGVRFEPRTGGDPRKRPVREIAGVDPALLERWSARRHRIVARQAQLAAVFQRDHGRPPTPVEAIALAQQATLETREAKHEPRSLAEQRTTWRTQARAVLGGDQQIAAMIHQALHPAQPHAAALSPAWFAQAAERIVSRVELDRSAWQSWHVRAEALRLVRTENIPADRTAQIVEQLTGHVLGRSIPLTPATDGVAEPALLRRRDGESVYTVSGNRLYTSSRILAAEERILTHAGRMDGRVVSDAAVDLAFLETAGTGVPLNSGQLALVHAMATSGARVQLAIAPAGAGKTTAMQALATAWTAGGGTVIGLAPSAVAAAGLGEQIGAHADTIAKLAWHLAHGDPPAWMDRIGPASLVIIDEAGMADTLSLDAVISHVIAAGGSVRLIGDDQQLAAIGAGGVLRDIQATHGALQLNELVRFADPAEGSASLALRDGHSEALGFYLDRNRVQVGTPDTMLDQLFQRWAADRAAGLDSVMLAPTREFVAQLNQRARTDRLDGAAPDAEVELADGTAASAGDVVITRRNERRLRLNASDWVKNGDRWTIETVTADGVRVRHTQTGRHITLPKDYVGQWAELGYATTTHSAQGVTADTCHGLLTGDETRQQAYTMLTRGRRTNTCYLTVVGDGDPHSLIRPEAVNPVTAVDQLEQVLARDESPLSATTTLRQSADPKLRLGNASARYADAIVFAADHATTPADRHTIQVAADRLLPGITRADAWPALFAHLLSIDADQRDPIQALTEAAARPVIAGRDPAAILASRLDDLSTARRGPLPWLNPIPATLTHHPVWGDYLAARAGLVHDLADQVRTQVEQETAVPLWAADGVRPPTHLVAEIEIWRASHQLLDSDLRPTGEPQPTAQARRCQERLDRRLGRLGHPALDEWGDLLRSIDPLLAHDDYLSTLASRIAQAASAGIDIHDLLRQVTGERPLSEEHTAAALWWRLSGQLSPAITAQILPGQHLPAAWLPRLDDALGEATTRVLRASSWWPALVTTIEHALQRGWTLHQLIERGPTEHNGGVDACQSWVWRISLATRNAPSDEVDDPRDQAPDDLAEGWAPTDHLTDMVEHVPAAEGVEDDPASWQPEFDDPDAEADRVLAIEALIRQTMGTPEPSAAEIRRQQDRADAWRDCPHTPERLAHINELTTRFYETRLPDSWAQPYLTERLRQDITGHDDIRPGYAPDGWTGLVGHLRSLGVTDDEMLTAGVATRASTGRLIDRFRDRLVFPITHDGQVLGFVARRNPANPDGDARHGPKYLNTAETPLFHKGDQLYVPTARPDATPVLVEGPLDALAVTFATEGRHVGVAPLGTGLTEPQASQLVAMSREPIIATDADEAGRAAAERDYWLLAALNARPRWAKLPDGNDPASLVVDGKGDALADAVISVQPMWKELLRQTLDEAPNSAVAALTVAASAPPADWPTAVAFLAGHLNAPSELVRVALAPMVKSWNANPRRVPIADRDHTRARVAAAPPRALPSQTRVRVVCRRP